MKPDMETTVLQAQAGDRRALEELLVAIERPLFGYLTGLLHDRAGAEDALQETFVTIYKKLRWLREARFFQAWAFRIASRVAFKQLGRAARRQETPLSDSMGARMGHDDRDMELLVTRDTLRHHLSELSPSSRAVIHLHYIEGMGLRELSDVLEIPLGTVKSRLHYGLELLRRHMAEDTASASERHATG